MVTVVKTWVIVMQFYKIGTILAARYKIPLVPSRDTTGKTSITDFDKNISMLWREERVIYFVDKLWSRIVVDIFILTMEEEGTGRGGR